MSSTDVPHRESHRVTRPDALMAFKWNDHDMKLQYIFSLMSDHWEPLFGHWTRNGPQTKSQTYWVMLRRKDFNPRPQEEKEKE